MPFSAGTLYLQVVPVFKNVQDGISKQAKAWDQALGDELEKSGREAGRRANKAIGEELGKGSKEQGSKSGEEYSGAFRKAFQDGLGKINRELAPIEIKAETNGVRKELAQVRREFSELGDQTIGVDIDAKEAYAEFKILEARLHGLKADARSIKTKLEIDEALRGAETLSKRLERALPDIEIPVHIETKAADRQLGAFERKFRETAKRAARELGDSINPELRRIAAELNELGDVDIGVDMDSAAALAKLTELKAELGTVDGRDIDVAVDVDSAAAEAHLAGFFALVEAVDGKDIDVDVDVDTGGAAAKVGALSALLALFSRNAGGASAGGNEVANSFRAFNGVVLAAVTLLPALVPALAAVGGGLLALLPILGALTAGIGAVVIGFSGIGDAVSALGDVQDNAAKDAASAGKTMTAAANSVADAETALARARQQAAWAAADSARAVADAKREAAQAIAEAIKQQKRAQEDYADSVKDVKRAEEELAQARKDAAKDQMDLDNQVAQNKLDIESGVIAVFNAQVNFNAVMADGSSTNLDKDQARIALEQAELQLKELRQEQVQLADEKAKADKKGIDGSDKVKSAQDALTNALQAQRHAQEQLKDAADAVTKAQVDGARRIADAERAAARSRISSAQSVADAQKNLARAQQGYADALTQTGDLGSASMQKLETAMGKLSPAGRKFARFIFGLKKQFYDFRSAIQEALLPPVQRALQGFLDTYGTRMTRFFVRMARVAGDLFENLSKALRGPVFKQFFAMMDRFGPKLLRQFGNTSINWLKIFARFMTIAGPAALALSKAMLRISKAVLEWTKSKSGTETIQRFLAYARKVGPVVADFFWNLVLAVVNIMEALAPFGELVLKALDAFLRFIASMDPKTLGTILTLIVGMVIAFQAGVGVIAAIGAGAALFAGGALATFGLVVAAVILIVVALVALYVRFAKVRTVVNAIFDYIVKHWKGIAQIFLAWAAFPVFLYVKFESFRKLVNKVFEGLIWYFQNVVIPFWGILFKVIAAVFVAVYNAWVSYLQPTLKAIGKVILWLVKNIVVPYFKLMWTIIKGAFIFIRGLWNHILFPILDLIGTVIVKLFVAYWKPKVDKMKSVWHDFATGIKYLWDQYGQPTFDFIKDKALPKLQKAFETVVGAIQTAWGALKKYIAEPVFTVIDLILNKGIINGFNVLAKFVGSKPMDPVDLPFTKDGDAVKKATGGILPGYTPGRDTHKFYSATAGRLELSGGEAIMRPEWTRAMGPGWIDQMNLIARTQGARGVQQAMSGGVGHYFAKGGVLKNPDAPVMVNGKKIAAVFAAQMGIAAKLGGPSWYLMQGGFGGNPGNEGYSGSSHDYPGVGDLGRSGLSFYDQEWARKVGLHGWARNIPGAATAGSGAHVHALSIFSPGTRNSPQMAAGSNGLGGSDYGPNPGVLPNIGELLANFDLSNLPKGAMKVVHNYPSFLKKIISGPVDWAKGLITGPLKDFQDKFDSPFAKNLGKIPGQLVKKMASKALDMIPAVSAFNAAGHLISGAAHGVGDVVSGAGHLAGDVVGHIPGVGMARGGVLPYNGVMKYDAGGYLPPGLTSVVNLTGKPEPVLTHDQFDGGGAGDDVFHYEPHFEGSDLTSEDVFRDADHARRKWRREGKYGRKRR